MPARSGGRNLFRRIELLGLHADDVLRGTGGFGGTVGVGGGGAPCATPHGRGPLGRLSDRPAPWPRRDGRGLRRRTRALGTACRPEGVEGPAAERRRAG